ncbi:helix-hairpin-helix domain-containing protein [Natronoglomus mannanivorans]|uniref:Helix-hairpin-helix domain-containing protein n=1 Tax=Natronoglomus mannanivorans TaxID=2979990 RepID=A0AAP2YW17_9EURY|nr:helix-hairpin-helix domain-containing protein [Halobacteria archaeon AArc-xg1-1]
MTPPFTDDDLEKRVENANGAVIGTVTAVEGDTARVEPSAGVMDSIRAALGWERAHEDTVVIHEDAVGEVSDEVIRLEADESTRDEPDAPGIERSESEPKNQHDYGVDVGGPDDLGAETGLEADSGAARDSTAETPLGRPGESERSDPGERGTEAEWESEPSGEPVDETRVVEGMDGTGELEPGPGPESELGAEPGPESELGAELGPESEPEAELGPESEPGAELESESEPKSDPDSSATSDRELESETTEAGTAEAPTSADETAGTDEEGERSEDEPLTTPGETASPEEPSETESMDIEAVMDDTDLTEGAAGSPADDAVGGPTADESDPDAADDLTPGIDADSLEEASRTETEGATEDGDERETEPNAAAERSPADEVSQGIDVDSLEEAGETESWNETAPAETDTEPEPDPGPAPASETIDSADELNPGADVESLEDSTEEPDDGSARVIDPETLEEGRTDAELGLETSARRIGPEIDPGTETVRLASEGTARRGADVEGAVTAESETTDQERDRIPGHAASPVAATFAAQRTAIEQGQQVVQRGLDTNQRIVQTTLEGQARIQRRSLEVFQTATTSYVETVAATMDAASDRGSSSDRSDAEQTTQQLQDHLDRVRELQDRLDEQVDRQHERTTALLEKQLDRVDRIQQELSADAGRLEHVDGLDSMYRERLETASITSLEDLARADAETVADAADVTEKRAESWIEQAEI